MILAVSLVQKQNTNALHVYLCASVANIKDTIGGRRKPASDQIHSILCGERFFLNPSLFTLRESEQSASPLKTAFGYIRFFGRERVWNFSIRASERCHLLILIAGEKATRRRTLDPAHSSFRATAVTADKFPLQNAHSHRIRFAGLLGHRRK